MSTAKLKLSKHGVASSGVLSQDLPVIALRILLRVLVNLMLVPILLLYAGTAVPWIFMALLLAIDGFLMWRLFRHTNAADGGFLLIFAFAAVALLLYLRSVATPSLAGTVLELGELIRT